MHKRRACIFTIIFDEPVFLTIWLKYYMQYFRVGAIYVLEGKRDGGIHRYCWNKNAIGYNVKTFTDFDGNDSDLSIGLVQMAQREQAFLFNKYKYVLYTDVDEIVWHPHGLDKYIADIVDVDVVSCDGYELVQKLNEEPALDLSRPIMQQRRYWYPSLLYSKPLLSRVRLDWNTGFHSLRDRTAFKEPELKLIHLHKMDFDIALARNRSRFPDPETTTEARGKHGYQNRLDSDGLREFWLKSIDTGLPVALQEIPDYIRNINV